MYMKKFLYLAAVAAATMSLAGCNKDMTPTVKGLNGPEISIRTVGANSITKSAMNGTAFPQGYDMLVSAYRNLGPNAGEDVAADYFEGIRFGYDDTSGSWKSEMGVKYYPLDGTLDFLAVASAGINASGTGSVPTAVWGESSNVAKKVVLTVPDNSAKFDDLMYGASNAEGLSASGTGITFKHAMTSVVFLAKCNVAYNAGTNAGITVDGITIDGAKHSGTLTVSNPSAGGGSGDLSAAWSSLGDAQTHVAARVWNASNTGILTNESALANLNLGTASKALASYPFGEAYVILPPQAAVPFTVTYTIHNGFASDGSTPLNKQVQYQYIPSGTWDMGKKNVYEIEFDLTEILVNPDIVDWDEVENDLIQVPEPEPAATFAGLQIAAGPLFYNGSSYEIKDSWNFDSFDSVYGKESGSYYFNFFEMGQLFEDPSFDETMGDIDNVLDPLDGWRLPTSSEWASIVGTTRDGSTVNGTPNAHWAYIEFPGVTNGAYSYTRGLLIFPDGTTITGKALQRVDIIYEYDTVNDKEIHYCTTGVTVAELNAYLEQGCAFLPEKGYCESYDCESDEWCIDDGYYWSSTEWDASYGYFFHISSQDLDPVSCFDKECSYYSVRLVRE